MSQPRRPTGPGPRHALERRPLGTTGLEVPVVCAGAGPLGSVPVQYGYEVDEERALRTVVAIMHGPIGFIDTSAIYSRGESERRIGAAIARVGGVPSDFVLATKVDRDPDTGDFSGAQMRRSIEGSLERLGVDRVPLLYLHDPEHTTFEEAMAAGGPVEELVRIRDDGLARHIGLAGGPVELMGRYLREGMFEVLLSHNRWSLVDRSADELFDLAVESDVAVVNAAPFGGGILARGTGEGLQHYGYRPADDEVLARIRAMEEACADHGVPLAAAALQFSTRDPRIASTVVGITRPERVDTTVGLATLDVPEPLWERLTPLAAPPDRWLW